MMFKWIAFSSALLASSTAMAGWQLNDAESNFSFSSIKKNNVMETHRFEHFTSSINDQGEAKLTLDLTSVNSGIEIRDQRMKEILFETTKYSTSTFLTQLDMERLASQKIGDVTQQKITGVLSLHGIEKEVSAAVNIIKLSDSKIIVSSLSPISVQASDFALEDGITTLKDIAKLPSIAFSVPVSFHLTYTK